VPRSESPEPALSGSGTSVIVPEQVIRTETVVSRPPAAHESAALAPARPQLESGPELGVLCGVVRDTDGRAVARAQVMMADVAVIVLTDRSGHFCLTAPVGDRTLSVAAVGFTASRRLVSVNKRTPELSVTLKPVAPYPTSR